MELEFFTRAAGLAAMGVVIVEQILKLKFIPAAFANRYPVVTNLLLSVVASMIAVWKANAVEPITWYHWAALIITIAVVAAIIYNNLLRNWKELRATEGY